MSAHEVRYAGLGHGWFVVRKMELTVSGPWTTRAQAEQDAWERDNPALVDLPARAS